MISDVAAQQAMSRLGSADWALKSQAVAAAFGARDDEHFWQLLAVAAPDVVKVGPKGYIHGWIFVGAPGVGAKVHHPVHGDGTVTAHDGKHATVKFDKSGATHTFEVRKGTGKGGLVERDKHNANNVVTDNKHIKTLSDSELHGVDKELTRRATAIGKPGEVGRSHQKVKDELKRRSSGGKVTGVSQESGKNYEELRRKATVYNATSPPKEGSALRTYSDPEKQKEAIRLHTEARRAAPDAKSKKLHTDAINQHKAYLAQIEHNQNMARFNKDKADTEAKIKELNRRNVGGDPKVYDDIAAAHDHLADIHEQHQKDLTAAGHGGQYGHEVAADKARGRADAARESAANIRARQDEAHAKIKAQMPGAEAKVAEWDKAARQSGKKEDIERAAQGHEQIARHAGMIGDQKRVDEHTAAAQELRNLTPAKAPRKASVPKKTAEPKEQTPDDLSKKAKSTGAREDHHAAGNAHAAIANDQSRPASERRTARYKAEEHKRAVESIDMADELKEEAGIHADAAEQTKDPEAHDSAAGAYRDAAEHMDDVPGGKKQAAALRASAKDHEEQAKTLRQKVADYVSTFIHANKLTNAARKSGTAAAHHAAAAAQRAAARHSVTAAQERHHLAEAARHTTAARNVE